MIWLIVGVCCVLPLAWMALTIASHPRAVLELHTDAFRLKLLARTLLLAGGAAAGAVLLGLPAALLIGRTRRAATALWLLLPVPVLVPTLVLTYAWTQALELLHARPVPQSVLDELRCVAVLATWLWPIAAGVMGVTLRRTDAAVLEQAALDGALGRLLARRLVTPGIAAFLICAALASQEFAVFEPTGISVMATEIRMVFETGAFSSSLNPIAALQGGLSTGELTADQPDRAAAALATGLPAIVAALVCALAGTWLARRAGPADDMTDLRPPARVAALGMAGTIGGWTVLVMLVVTPVTLLTAALNRRFDPLFIYAEYAPRLHWSLLLAGVAALLALGVTAAATVVRPGRLLIATAIVAFLVGGQFMAIATIRLYNHTPWFLSHAWSPQHLILRSDASVVLAYLGRFAWIPLLAGALTWRPDWRALRDLAAADGADAWQTTRHVILPLAWPAALAAGVLVGVLSLAEVPATALLAPLTLVPMLLTWVHMQRYDPMLEASLLIVVVVVTASVVVVLLGKLVVVARR